VEGFGTVHIRATGINIADEDGGQVEVVDGHVRPHLGGRSYWASKCAAGDYEPSEYVALSLLGRRLRYTTDISGAGCGCNAALYLTPMWKNPVIGTCEDYYCDAQSVCGVACEEIDIQENNRFAWASTLHAMDDHWGKAAGFGGGSKVYSGPRDFSEKEYGPNGSCVDTDLPFEVAASFPMADDGWLAAMVIELSQTGMPCNVSMNISGYDGNFSRWREGTSHGMKQMTEILSQGMTPIISFWQSRDMLWLDGKGEDGQGPCKKDLVVPCSETVSFYDFFVEELAVSPLVPLEADVSPSLRPAQAPAPAAWSALGTPQLISAASATVLVVGSIACLCVGHAMRRGSPSPGAE